MSIHRYNWRAKSKIAIVTQYRNKINNMMVKTNVLVMVVSVTRVYYGVFDTVIRA